MKAHPPVKGTIVLLTLSVLLPAVSHSQLAVTDDFISPTPWGPPMLFSADSAIFVANGRMNYTCTTTLEGGGAIPRSAPLLPAAQDWSMKVEVHLDSFNLTTEGQFSDLFLGVGKTGDELNNHVMFEFGRGRWGLQNGYYIEGNGRINGTDTTALFEVGNINITATMSALRLDYESSNRRLTFYWGGGLGGVEVSKIAGIATGSMADKVEKARGGTRITEGTGGIDIAQLSDAQIEEILSSSTVEIAALPEVEGLASKNANRSGASIRGIPDANVHLVKNCYNRYKRKDVNLKGKVKVEWSIEPDGRVSRVKILSSEWTRPPLGRRVEDCLTEVIGTWLFDPIPQESGKVRAAQTYIFD